MNMENIFTAAKPFLRFSRILGLFPMNFESASRKGVLKVKRQGIFFSCVAVTVLTCLFLFIVKDRQNMRIEANAKSIAHDFGIFFELFAYVVHVTSQLAKRKCIVRFLNLVSEIDDEASDYR